MLKLGFSLVNSFLNNEFINGERESYIIYYYLFHDIVKDNTTIFNRYFLLTPFPIYKHGYY